MGSELVTDLLPDDEGERGKTLSPFRYTNIFRDSFPYYLAVGMTPEAYWYGDSAWVRAYREAYKLQRQQANEQAWWNGLYVYEALMDVHPAFNAWSKRKIQNYPKTPYDFGYLDSANQEATRRKKLESGKLRMEQYMIAFNSRFKGGDLNGD